MIIIIMIFKEESIEMLKKIGSTILNIKYQKHKAII